MTDTFNPLLHNLRPTNFRQGEWVKGRGTWDEIARPVLRVGSARWPISERRERMIGLAEAIDLTAYIRAERRICASVSSGNCWVGGKPSTAGDSTAWASASRLAAR